MSNEVSQAALDRTKEITDKLEAGLKALFEGDNFRNYLNTMSKFHNYSFNNTMLIALQKPDATYVAGFNSWKKNFERSVNKGEKGIKIFAPAPYKMKKEQTKIDPDTELPVLDKDGKPVIEEVEVTIPAFKVVSVFDVSQTNGKELPTLGVDELKGDVENFEKFFGVLKEVSPVPIKFDDIDGSAKGFYHHEDKAITVKTGMSDVQTIKTAIHEIAHAKLHDRDLVKADIENPKKDRKTEEVEAESIAYTVCQHFGIDTSDYSFAYVASWGSGIDTPELKSSLETIRSTASELITQISNRLRELDKERTAEQAVESAKENKISAPENSTTDNSTAEKQKNSNIIGNTPYKDIQNKFYIKIPTESVPDIEKLFESEKVSYSGRKVKSTTTITINEADYMNVSSLLANAGIKPLQESIPTVKKSLVPLYTKDRITAKENGETAECLNSFKENRSCAAAIDKALNENYSENRLDTDKALNTVVEQFGIERVNHVLSAQIVNHDWDGRYHNDVKAWAKEQMKDYSAEFIEDSRSYYLNAHPVLIDGIASKAMVRQNEIGLGNSSDLHKDAKEHQRKTIVINAFGGAGAGKTTAALSIAAELKKKGFVTEYVPEYAKELILSNNLAALDGSMENQRKVYEEQKNRIDRCIGKVDFIVTDCPIIISGMFLNDCPEKEGFQKEILEQFNKNENFSFVIQRDETKFEQENRMGTFEEAKAMDDDIQKYLKDNNVQFGCYDHDHLDTVVQNSIKTYQRVNGVQQPQRKQVPKQEQDKNIIGNTAYKDISEKYFVKMTAERAQQLAPVLIQNGVRFSGRISGDKATLTIDKSDVELYKTLSASKEDILKSKRENVINALKEYENAENFQKTAEEAMAVVMQEYDELVDENGEIQDPEIKAAMMEKIRSAYTVAQSAENNLNQKESELSMASAEFEALTKDNEPEIASTEEAAPVQPESESKWRMYVIPDLKTWADNGKTAPQTPIEYFNTFAEAKERFDVLRNQAYNSEKATINGLPAARLTLGLDSNSKKMALDILHVRDNQNVLVDDFTRYESVLNDKEAMALILQTSEEIGFNSVMSFQKLENGKFADKPEFIPFEKWDNPVLPKKQTNEKAVVQTENGSMLYTQSFDYAQKHSESKEFQASHKENMRCLWDIKATAEIYAAEGRMDKFLQDLTSEYGVERPLYVLSRTIQSVDDKRFSPEAKQIADKFDYPDIGQVHSFTHLYVTDIKPSVIDEMVCKLNNMQQEAEIISEEPKYTGEFPDESVSIKDMESFGYMFLPENEMLPLSTEKAVELFDKGANIYLLYPDNTEGQVDSRSDILNSKGCMFGIERKDFENFTAFEQLKQQIAEKEPERMEKLLNSDDKVTVGIFQLKDEPSTRRLMFSSFDEVGGEVLRDNYNLVYSLEEKDFSDKNMLLESMFAKFNGDYPEDYQGRSVSMSDVIAVNDHGNLSVHYVDRLGFKGLDNFLDIQRTAEQKQELSDKNVKAPEEKPVQKPTKLSKTAAHKKQEEKRPSVIGAINEIKKKSQQQSSQQPNKEGIEL